MSKKKIKCLSIFAITATAMVFSSLPEENNNNLYSNAQLESFESISASEYTPYRILADKDIEGYSVKTDDGAIWIAKDEASRRTVKSWRVNDTLVIHPCFFPYWSGGTFYILNERLQTTVVVDLAYKQPYENSFTSVAISAIYPNINQIEVIDAYNRTFRFTVDSSDLYLLSDWRCGHYILFGSNQNCVAGTFSSHPYIIINIHTRNYLRASIL